MQEIYDLFSPVIFQIGPLKFYWYGLFYAISFYFGYKFIGSFVCKDFQNNSFGNFLNPKQTSPTRLVSKNLKNNYSLLSEQEFDKLFFGIAIFALIGGRLGHVLFYDFGYYSQNILEIFQVWKGGMASHGGIIGAIIGFFIFRKNFNLKFYFSNFLNPKQASPTRLVSKNLKNKILNFFTLSFFDKKLLDLFAISGAFGFGLGRLGNFINGELFGKQIENFNFFTNFIGVNFGDGVLRHPVQIYSSLANFLIFGILFFLLQKKYFQEEKNFGKIFYLFLIFFGIQRFFLEFLKENFVGNNYFEILTTGQIFSVLLILIGSFLFFYKNNLKK